MLLGALVRITVYEDSDTDSGRVMVGWFDRDRAEHFRPDPLQCPQFADFASADSGQSLYRTSQGRWVLGEVAAHTGEGLYRFLSPAQARLWLNSHGRRDVAARYFSRGTSNPKPRKAGRPEVGGPVTVRLGDDLLTDLDNYAGAHNLSRANAIRDLIKTALTDVHSVSELAASN